MKICINSQFKSGPYGGGMQFANSLRDYLIAHDIEVVNSLKDENIDIILHVNPFPFLNDASQFSYIEAYRYKKTHPKTHIILRVNECDERKGTKYMNSLLRDASRYADHIVYIATWLKPLLSLSKKPSSSVILNGADPIAFNSNNKDWWDGKRKLRIVTHHWSDHPLKGHDVYQYLDELLGGDLGKQFEFTYVGKVPASAKYLHSKIINPISGIELGDELRKHDIYITASQNEPAGMHHIEGALSGLPILYVGSGALPEYCRGFGIEFSLDTLTESLLEMKNDFNIYRDKITEYDNTSEKMNSEFLNLFKYLQMQHPIPYSSLKGEAGIITLPLFETRARAIRKIL